MVMAKFVNSYLGAKVKIILVTERLIVRHLTIKDAPDILELLNEPSWLKFIGDKNVRTLQDAENYLINGPLTMYQNLGFGLFAVISKADGKFLGISGLIKRDSLPNIDIGFAFLERYWGNGFAYEASHGVLKYAKDILRLDKVVAIVDPANSSSLRLLNKIGMEFEKMVLLEHSKIELALLVTNWFA